MECRAKELLDELSQLSEQYKVEVPGSYRAWPRSVRERVVALRQMKVKYSQIEQVSGISKATLYSWTRQERIAASKSGFKQLALVSRESKESAGTKPITATVIGRCGLRVEGLSFAQVKELLGVS